VTDIIAKGYGTTNNGEGNMDTKIEKQMRPRFRLGQTVMTSGVATRIPQPEVLKALHRHQCGDWGNVPEDDWKENDHSLQEGFRLLSAYQSQGGEKFWIITEWDRSLTTVLLPEEY
jgi:hypothetical protein